MAAVSRLLANVRVGPPRRAMAAVVAAAVALGAAVAASASWTVAVLFTWDASAVVYLGLVWPIVATTDAEATAQMAQNEEGSPRTSEGILLGAGTTSLIAVGFTLAQAGSEHDGRRAALSALAVVSVALAWACIHTVYTLRYARLYFTPPAGGLAFAGTEPPQYLDFAYVAFTIGMTFQVSDTDISRTTIRRAALRHSLLSYLFGAVILAIAVSTVASLLGR